jgi:hypothetical protein
MPIAGRTPQPPRPIGNRGVGTVPCDLIGNVGLGPVPAAFASPDQPDLGGERLAERHRRRLAVASIAPHNRAMTAELTDDNKAILAEHLRETIGCDPVRRA